MRHLDGAYARGVYRARLEPAPESRDGGRRVSALRAGKTPAGGPGEAQLHGWRCRTFVVRHLERAGFEVHGVENIGIHYALTIDRWYERWTANRAEVVRAYGERWFRLWQVFLGWSVAIAAQGSSTAARHARAGEDREARPPTRASPHGPQCRVPGSGGAL